MSYTFVNVQNRKQKYLKGWYLKCPLSNTELLMKMGKVLLSRALKKLTHGKTCKINIVKMGEDLYKCWDDLLFSNHKAIYFNPNGSWMADIKGYKTHETRESDKLVWPTEEDEVITISRWRRGGHWYLSSSANRMFEKNGFSTCNGAETVAKNYVKKDFIIVKEVTVQCPY